MIFFILAPVLLWVGYTLRQQRRGKEKISSDANKRVAKLEADRDELIKLEEIMAGHERHVDILKRSIELRDKMIERRDEEIEHLRATTIDNVRQAADLIMKDLDSIAARHDERTTTVVKQYSDAFTKPYVEGFDRIKSEFKVDIRPSDALAFMQKSCDTLKTLFEENQRDTAGMLRMAGRLKSIVIEDVKETVAESAANLQSEAKSTMLKLTA
jgi:hypothetical protein